MIRRVLVCEDEDSIREFVVINLRRSGYEVTDVNCGEDALKAYEEAEGRFDIALLDIMMPGINGMEVCKKLREKSATLGIIMLSAKSQEMDKISSLMIGADDYITKPFSMEVLVVRIETVLRRVCGKGRKGRAERARCRLGRRLSADQFDVGGGRRKSLCHCESSVGGGVRCTAPRRQLGRKTA